MREFDSITLTIRMPRPCGVAADRVRVFAGVVPVVGRVTKRNTGGAH